MNCQTSLCEFIIYRIFKMQLAIIRIMTEYNLLCENAINLKLKIKPF